MEQTAEIIADSISPTGQRLTTFLINHWRGIHPELLRHRLFSFSVASSRAIPYSVQSRQVKEDPMLPIIWPKQHKGMQGNEIFEDPSEIRRMWEACKDLVSEMSDNLTTKGLSKQLSNRLLEPWVNTRAVVTATDFDNFFELRHPWHYEDRTFQGHDFEEMVWETAVNLEFPAEYNIQDLALKMRNAMEDQEPVELKEGEWHLPFVEQEDVEYAEGWEEHDGIDGGDVLRKISAARCARTSYGKNIGKTIEAELELADLLLKDKHLSPFEHQGQALEHKYTETHLAELSMTEQLPKGAELRVTDHNDWYSKDSRVPGRKLELWSGNFRGWIQYRKVLDG